MGMAPLNGAGIRQGCYNKKYNSRLQAMQIHPLRLSAISISAFAFHHSKSTIQQPFQSSQPKNDPLPLPVD